MFGADHGFLRADCQIPSISFTKPSEVSIELQKAFQEFSKSFQKTSIYFPDSGLINGLQWDGRQKAKELFAPFFALKLRRSNVVCAGAHSRHGVPHGAGPSGLARVVVMMGSIRMIPVFIKPYFEKAVIY